MFNILKKKNASLPAQFVRYFISGVLASSADFFSFFVLTTINVHYLLANIVSFLIGFCVSYPLNKNWVFKSSKLKKSNYEALFFLLLSGVGLLVQEVLLFILIGKLGQNDLLSKLVTMVLVLLFNFTTRKLFLFN
ncbi:GtrA family protein [Candidatus Woesearchaeota archaeon]|nr:GtrA family protein [Candidatus Woesearchaeota archaeon]